MRYRARTDDGFTLVELMVVVLIIAILIAIAVPTFLGSRRRAQDSAAKALVRLALSAELVHYQDSTGFSADNTDGGVLDSIEPDIDWGTLSAGDKGVIATVTGTGNNTAILRSQSQTNTVFCVGRIADTTDAGTYYTTACAGTETTASVAAWPATPDAGW